MQTNDQVLLRFAEDLRLRGLAPITQKHFMWNARVFLEWSNRNTEELGEEDIQNYLTYLTDNRKLRASTVRVRSSAIRLLFGTIFIDGGFSPEPRRKLVKDGCLKESKEGFMRYLHDMGYAKKSQKNYRWVIKCVDQFMHERGYTQYSRTIGEVFLKDAAQSGRYSSGNLRMIGYVLRRFDCFMERGDFTLLMPSVSRESPPQFAEGFTGYLGYMRLRGFRESTIEQHRRNIQKALQKFDAAAIRSFSEINPKAIYDAFEKTSGKQSFCSPIRGLLRYLFKSGIIKYDYSEFVPSVRKARPVPSVYTVAETEKLLDSVEADGNSVKRNNAIILLALRLGMRSGDIANMKMADVDFIGRTISFVQEKTLVPQLLELLPEVERAMLSYISDARPDSSIPNVFLSVKAPIRAISNKTVYSLVSNRFEKSGVDTGERKRGGHALRMTLSSELVAENVPYEAVRKILGQEDPESTKHYVKYDIEALRSCSIEIPTVTGNLAAYMEARIGGGS